MAEPVFQLQPEVGYVVMGFPRLSEAFISQEVLLLEQLGLQLRVFAIKAGDSGPTHDSVRAMRSPIDYLPPVASLSGTPLWRWLRKSVPGHAAAHGRVLRRHPLRWLGTFGSALTMCVRYRKPDGRPRKVFLKEFLQAGTIADAVLRQGTIAHLHGHFCHGATTITWYAARMTGRSFSFTAHAKDIYQADQNPGDLLPRKLRAARFATTCTGANHTHLAGRYPGQGQVHTVYHGLDTQYFAPRAPAVASAGPPVILAVGRFVEKKGLRYLVEALGQLAARGLEFRCRMVGEDGGELPWIRERLAALGLAERVMIEGPVTHAELREIYAGAAVFVLPCLVAADGDRDGIPNVMAEAMAMGLPVISTDVSGIPELLTDGLNGRLVPERDAVALAEALAGVLADPAHGLELGRAARATILERFDARRTTADLKALFDAVLAEGRGVAAPMAKAPPAWAPAASEGAGAP